MTQKREKEFDVYHYMDQIASDTGNNSGSTPADGLARFEYCCTLVKSDLDASENLEHKGQEETALDRQRKAILGYPNEVNYYKAQIKDILIHHGIDQEWHPDWYQNMANAVYNEILGFGGLAEWIEGRSAELESSSSAKMIGDRIYFMIDGQLVLQAQTFSPLRRQQLKKALLLGNPEKRSKAIYHEVYLQDGTRVTMYNEGLAKRGQESIVFRKFFVRDFTFEEQARRHTIPSEAISLFKSMVQIGFNVAFIGPVRSAKTTFLTTWQSHEDPKLEGVLVESDPEIPLHEIMPEAPILQFVPDDDAFGVMVKRIMRSDADYIIMAEARDGVALDTAVKAANKGTRRVKMTYHTTDALDFAYDVAEEIVRTYGGDLGSSIVKVSKSFHYILQFDQLADKSQKRLVGLWEMLYNRESRQIEMHQLCKYDYLRDDWTWAYALGPDQMLVGQKENISALADFQAILTSLAERCPMDRPAMYVPSYDHLTRGVRQ